MYVILNPLNDMYWSRSAGRFVSERTGEYTTYSTAAKAEQALRRTRELRQMGYVVVPEPAHERALRLEERI